MQKIKKENILLNIIYEDKSIIVIDKKKNTIIHTNNSMKKGTLINGIVNHINNFYDMPRSGLIHRLDKDTTGLMVIAKNIQSQKNLLFQFKKKVIKKFYVTLVKGNIISGNLIKNCIKRDYCSSLKMKIESEKSFNSVTHYRILKKYKQHTLLKVKIESGKTHQIRLHFSNIKHPILGDYLYNYNDAFFINERKFHLFLHASALMFYHPISRKKMFFFSDIPYYYKNILEKLD